MDFSLDSVFGPVIPIAAFFYLGDAGFFSIFGTGLPETSRGWSTIWV